MKRSLKILQAGTPNKRCSNTVHQKHSHLEKVQLPGTPKTQASGKGAATWYTKVGYKTKWTPETQQPKSEFLRNITKFRIKGQCHEIFDLWFYSSNNPI
jgi:hypothetical protein